VASMVFLAAIGVVVFILVAIMLAMQFKHAKKKKKILKRDIDM
jgi:uncharacterized protein YggT (Ycf19 family)